MEILLSKLIRRVHIRQLEILAFNDYIKTTDWKSMSDIFILRREEKNIKINPKNLEERKQWRPGCNEYNKK